MTMKLEEAIVWAEDALESKKLLPDSRNAINKLCDHAKDTRWRKLEGKKTMTLEEACSQVDSLGSEYIRSCGDEDAVLTALDMEATDILLTHAESTRWRELSKEQPRKRDITSHGDQK